MTDATDLEPTASEALHTTLDMPFEKAVAAVQLEHEFAGFETVQVTRLDEMVNGMLGDEVQRVALIVVCHAEVARDAVEIDPRVAGLLPCTTAVYEEDGDVHVHHLSATKAVRDLGVADGAAVDELVSLTGERMGEVWENVEALAAETAE